MVTLTREKTMSNIYDVNNYVGCPIRVYDGVAKPQPHHKRKLEKWGETNYEGTVKEANALEDGSVKLRIEISDGPHFVYSKSRVCPVTTGYGRLSDNTCNYDIHLPLQT